MIRHHQGGLDMAEYAASSTPARPVVRDLARSIAETQTAETTTMERDAAARGGTPAAGALRPSPPGAGPAGNVLQVRGRAGTPRYEPP